MSGQRCAFVMTPAFSIEMRSAGSPSFIHSAMSESFVMILTGSIPSVSGISREIRSGIHRSRHSCWRNLAPNAPTYETNAAESSTSPTIVPSTMRS